MWCAGRAGATANDKAKSTFARLREQSSPSRRALGDLVDGCRQRLIFPGDIQKLPPQGSIGQVFGLATHAGRFQPIPLDAGLTWIHAVPIVPAASAGKKPDGTAEPVVLPHRDAVHQHDGLLARVAAGEAGVRGMVDGDPEPRLVGEAPSQFGAGAEFPP